MTIFPEACNKTITAIEPILVYIPSSFFPDDGPSDVCISMPTTFNESIKLLVTKLQRAVSTRYQIVYGDGPSDVCISTPTTHL